jgi:hypothetical protein
MKEKILEDFIYIKLSFLAEGTLEHIYRDYFYSIEMLKDSRKIV